MRSDGDAIAQIRQRLLAAPQLRDDIAGLAPDYVPEVPHPRPPVEAAVLIALIERQKGHTVLYTERSTALRQHSGQIAFPGGKLDPEDRDVTHAAIREAGEEVAMLPDEVDVIGYMPTYLSGSNYLITPVVAVVTPSAPFLPNPREVSSVFEVPLSVLGREENYSLKHIARGAALHSTWMIGHGGYEIWGITANLTRRFFEMALREPRP